MHRFTLRALSSVLLVAGCSTDGQPHAADTTSSGGESSDGSTDSSTTTTDAGNASADTTDTAGSSEDAGTTSTTTEESSSTDGDESTGEPTDDDPCTDVSAQTGVAWVRGYLGPDREEILAVASHPDGDVVVAGLFTGPLDFGDGVEHLAAAETDAFVAKLTVAGDLVWVRVLAGTEGHDWAVDLEIGDDGDVLVLGGFTGSIDLGDAIHPSAGGTDGFVVELDAADGTTQWSRAFGGAYPDVICCPDPPEFGRGEIAYDGDDAVLFVSRPASGGLGGGELDEGSAAVAKYGPDGEHLWSLATGQGEGYSIHPAGVAVAADGTIHLAGSHTGTIEFGGDPIEGSGSFLVELDADGGHLSTRGFADARIDAFALADDGDALVAGTHWDDIDLGGDVLSAPPGPVTGMPNVFIARFDDIGHVWSSTYGSHGIEIAGAIAAGPGDRIALSGTLDFAEFGGQPLSDPLDYGAPFVAVFEGDGTHVYSSAFTSVDGTQPLYWDFGTAVDFDAAGHLYAAGRFQDTNEFEGTEIMGSGGSWYHLEAFLLRACLVEDGPKPPR